MRINGYRLPNWLGIFIVLSVLFTGLSVGFLVNINTIINQAFVPPVRFSSEEFIMNPDRGCPGDEVFLSYDFVFELDRAATVLIVESWATPNGVNKFFSEHPTYTIADPDLLDESRAVFITKTVLVPDLPAGEYYLLHASYTANTDFNPAVFRSPFTILDSCE